MPANKRVRVIKRGARSVAEEAARRREHTDKTLRQTARDIAANVTGWVSEHRRKRETDMRCHFEQLFKNAA